MPDEVIVTPVVKVGYKTSEFWLSLAAMILGALLASGIIPSDGPWEKIIGLIGSVLGALGYTVSRTLVKK